MLKQLKNRREGFTIIEVLIVLAIAGLILLIVFLAVPALQRNSRNTQIRNDAGAVIGYVNEYASNNNGSLPQEICTPGNTGDVYLSSNVGCDATDQLGGKIRGSVNVTSSNGTAVNEDTTQQLTINLNRKCNGNNPAAGASPRAIAASFQVETSGTPLQQCTES